MCSLASFIFLENYTGREEGGERRKHHSGKTFTLVAGTILIFFVLFRTNKQFVSAAFPSL